MPDGIPTGEEAATKWLFDNYAVDKEALLNQFEEASPHKFPGQYINQHRLSLETVGMRRERLLVYFCTVADVFSTAIRMTSSLLQVRTEAPRST